MHLALTIPVLRGETHAIASLQAPCVCTHPYPIYNKVEAIAGAANRAFLQRPFFLPHPYHLIFNTSGLARHQAP